MHANYDLTTERLISDSFLTAAEAVAGRMSSLSSSPSSDQRLRESTDLFSAFAVADRQHDADPEQAPSI